MLTVSNGWLSKNISMERIMRVTKAGLENGKTGATDNARYMGPLDRIYDTKLCGNAKATVLDSFYEIGRQSALLHAELRKSVSEKNPTAIKACQEQIDSATRRINDVAEGKKIRIESGTAGVGAGARGYLIVSDPSNAGPTGIPLSGRPDQSATGVLPGLFCCTDPGQIQISDLKKITDNVKFNCAGRLITVRLTKENEPVVVSSQSDPQIARIQNRLTALWMKNLARERCAALDSLTAANPTLRVNPVLIGLGTGSISGTTAEQPGVNEWRRFAEVLQAQFNISANRLLEPLHQQIAALRVDLTNLADMDNPGLDERKKLNAWRVAQEQLVIKVSKSNKNIERLKHEFHCMSMMISCCTETLMVDIFKARIMHFQNRIAAFLNTDMGKTEVDKFNAILDRQFVFHKHFGPDEISQCRALLSPSATRKARDLGVTLPASSAHEKKLIDLLVDPGCALDSVQNAMKALKAANELALNNRIDQKALAEKLEANLKVCVLGSEDSGFVQDMEPDFRLNFYTPQTFSRIVTLTKMLADLSNPDNHFPRETLKIAQVNMQRHLRYILRENELINKYEHDDFSFKRPELHTPKRSPDKRLLDHRQWLQQAKNQETMAKIQKGRADLYTLLEITRMNIALFKKRGALIDSLSAKTNRYSETAQNYKTDLNKLKSAFN